MKRKSWSQYDLVIAAQNSSSIRQVLKKLNLIEAGGNYAQIKKYLALYKVDTSHFKGKLWSKGSKLPFKPRIELEDILIQDSNFQSYKLKARLFRDGLKSAHCEMCGWSEESADGRIPLELDHINGIHNDNRLENLRILCPNCHSLQSTHRGSNRKTKGPMVEWHTRGT